MTAANPPIKASLFATCIVDQIYPEVGDSAVRVLRRLGVDLDFAAAQTCCGQPAFNSGFWSEAKPLARKTVELYQNDRYVVTPSGSCASMMRVFYAELFHDEPDMRHKVAALASRTFELTEFIVDILGISDVGAYLNMGDADSMGDTGDTNAGDADAGDMGDMADTAADDTANADAAGRKRRVTYHEGCHLRRELGAMTQPRALLNSLPGVELVEMEQSEVCCGFGGTFSVKFPEISGAMLNDKLDFAAKSGADAITACDSSCLMHIGGGIAKRNMDIKPLHIAQVLDAAIFSNATHGGDATSGGNMISGDDAVSG